MYSRDTEQSMICDAEFFKIFADNYILIFLNDDSTDIEEWVMLDIPMIKQMLSQLDKLTDLGTYVDMNVSNVNVMSAQSFYAFPIYFIQESIVTGSDMFKEYIWLDHSKIKERRDRVEEKLRIKRMGKIKQPLLF